MTSLNLDQVVPRYEIGTKFTHFRDKREYEITDYHIVHYPVRNFTSVKYVVTHTDDGHSFTNWDGVSELTVFKSLS